MSQFGLLYAAICYVLLYTRIWVAPITTCELGRSRTASAGGAGREALSAVPAAR
jgi:hypothetical protein